MSSHIEEPSIHHAARQRITSQIAVATQMRCSGADPSKNCIQLLLYLEGPVCGCPYTVNLMGILAAFTRDMDPTY